MAFQYHRPRKQYLLLGSRQMAAENIVHIPEEETTQEEKNALPESSNVSGGVL
jgi:hypothetical protein